MGDLPSHLGGGTSDVPTNLITPSCLSADSIPRLIRNGALGWRLSRDMHSCSFLESLREYGGRAEMYMSIHSLEPSRSATLDSSLNNMIEWLILLPPVAGMKKSICQDFGKYPNQINSVSNSFNWYTHCLDRCGGVGGEGIVLSLRRAPMCCSNIGRSI